MYCVVQRLPYADERENYSQIMVKGGILLLSYWIRFNFFALVNQYRSSCNYIDLDFLNSILTSEELRAQ